MRIYYIFETTEFMWR